MNKIWLEFGHLKKYADFILLHHVDDVAREEIGRAKFLQLSILEVFKDMSQEQLLDFSKEKIREYLQQIVQDNIIDAISENAANWMSNNIPGIPRERISASDVSLINNIRKHSLLKFIPFFTTDQTETLSIISELQDLQAYQQSISIQVYSDIQKDLLFQAKELSQTIINTSPDRVLAFDTDLKVTEWNKTLELATGIHKSDILGKNVFEFFPMFEQTEEGKSLRKVLKGEHVKLNNLPFRNTKGFYKADIVPLYNEFNDIIGGLSRITDITERKLAEESIRKSEQQLMEAQEIAHFGSYDWDIVHDSTTVSAELYRIFGASPGDPDFSYNIHFQKVIHPEDAIRVAQDLQKAFESLQPYESEFRIVLPHGITKFVSSRGKVVADEHGKAIRLIGTVQDISPRKQAEHELQTLNAELEQRVSQRTKALEDSEKRYRFMAESVPAVVWTANPDGSIDYYNKKLTDYTGLAAEEITGSGWKTLPYPQDMQVTIDAWESALKSGKEFKVEHRIKVKSGNYRWMQSRALPLKDATGKIAKWFGTTIDIEDEKLAERRLKESEEKYRVLSESIPQLIWTCSANGDADYFNKQWLRYTGQTMEQALHSGWTTALHPHDLARTIKKWSKAVSSKTRYQAQYRLRRQDGNYRWFLAKGLPIKNKNGEVIKWFGTTTDIHDQKITEAELIQKNEQLVSINNDLDNFIYTASHDLKAPVSNIEGLINAMMEPIEQGSQEESVELLNMMKNSVTRFKTTIRDLTEIAKIQKEALEDVEDIDCKEVIDDVLQSINDIIVSNHACIELDLHDITGFKFSRKNFKSIVYNLLSNGIKYRDHLRPPLVKLSLKKTDKFICLTVSDNGLGIEETKIGKMFAMFKRFHDHVEGTGIGLYLVKKIVDNAGGKINVESKLGEGTSFYVYLPA